MGIILLWLRSSGKDKNVATKQSAQLPGTSGMVYAASDDASSVILVIQYSPILE